MFKSNTIDNKLSPVISEVWTWIWLGLLMLNSMLLLLQVHYLMVLSANWAYVKDACRMQKYEDIKSKEEQELHDIHSTRSKERLNAYT